MVVRTKEVEEAAERVVVAAATVGVAASTIAAVEAAGKMVAAAATAGLAAPTTAVQEAAEMKAAATRQGLGQVVEHPNAFRAVG